MVLFGSSLGHFRVKKFRPSKLRGDKIELFLAENKEKVLKTEVFRTFRGGDKRDRTADLLNAIQALSQLSYTPVYDYCVKQLSYYSNIKGICQVGFSVFLLFC